MFKKKPSFRSTKEISIPVRTLSSSPEPKPSSTPAATRVEVPKPKPTAPASIVPAGTKKVLVVGKFVVMTADVENCDAVIVQGNLDGNIKAKYVVVMKGGCMRGKVECEEADVAGSFEGVELTAHHRLTLSGTARVGGRTTYHRLSVHDGAVLTGELQYKPSLRDPKPSSPQTGEEPIDQVVPAEEALSAGDSGTSADAPSDEGSAAAAAAPV
ncbi:unnamed protein product [Pylaiella littoralis]